MNALNRRLCALQNRRAKPRRWVIVRALDLTPEEIAARLAEIESAGDKPIVIEYVKDWRINEQNQNQNPA